MKDPTSNYSISSITKFGQRKKKKYQTQVLREILPDLVAGAKVLEIGAGRGEFGQECLAQNLSYLAIEPSDSLRAQLESSGIDAIAATVPPIPLEDQKFDVVYANAFLEHLRGYEEVMETCSEIYRILKPGGCFSLAVPNYETLGILFFEYEYQHSYITTLPRMRALLEDCGFEIVRGRCFLFFMSSKWAWLDRPLAHSLLFIWRNSIIRSLFKIIISEKFVFRVTKNLYDNIGIVAVKPSK